MSLFESNLCSSYFLKKKLTGKTMGSQPQGSEFGASYPRVSHVHVVGYELGTLCRWLSCLKCIKLCLC